MEVGTEMTFTAAVKNGAATADGGVLWSVAPAERAPLAEGTKITPDGGILTVDENEANTILLVTATSKKDDRKYGTYLVQLYGKLNVEITADGSVPTSVQAGTAPVSCWLPPIGAPNK